jgi:nucleoside-diphosphate-sugar epimerase
LYITKNKLLGTGAFGLGGSALVPALQKKYGQDQVVALARETVDNNFTGLLEMGDVTDLARLEKLIIKYQIKEIYHLAGILSVGGEKNPQMAWNVNMGGLKNVLDLAAKYKLKVFWPSSIAAFGPTTPTQNTPQHTVLEPTTMYGVNKVAGELLGQYYHLKYGVDFRSLRYPGLNGYKADPGDGTTEYAIHIFYAAIKDGHYVCPLKPNTRLPMMYIDDAIAGTIQLMGAPAEKLTVRTSYNFAAISFTPAELVAAIQKIQPDFTVDYQPNATPAIADSWPKTIDDSVARHDWGWQEKFDLDKMTKALYAGVKGKINSLKN